MPVELWPDYNNTIYSNVFSLAPGKVCMLYATGLELERARVTDAEFKTVQSVCVRRVVHLATKSLARSGIMQDWIVASVDVDTVADDIVQNNGCCWELTHANNFRIIGVPGTYRLELNDATAVGHAQVYADLVDVRQVPPQIAHLFF